jgi:ADP-heptose:LPS heptosyltransferase
MRPSVPFTPASVNSILFVELTRLGDVVIMLPVIQSFRQACPSAKIFVAVNSLYRGLFKFVPAVDETIPCEDSNSVAGFNNAIKQVQSGSYDLICCMSPSSRNALMTLRTPAKMKIGYFDIHESVTPFLHVSSVEGIGVLVRNREVYAMENINLRAEKICRSLEIPLQNEVLWNIPESRIALMTEKLMQKGWEGNMPLIVIHPFSAWEYRQWSLKNYFTFANELLQAFDGLVVLLGSKEEWQKVNSSFQQMPQRMIRFDEIDVAEMFVVIYMASLFVGNDSGPLHLASACGTPAIGLFGPAAPELTGTKSGQNVYIYHRVECSPCRQVQCIRSENPCMDLITVQEVLEVAKSMLKKERSSPLS